MVHEFRDRMEGKGEKLACTYRKVGSWGGAGKRAQVGAARLGTGGFENSSLNKRKQRLIIIPARSPKQASVGARLLSFFSSANMKTYISRSGDDLHIFSRLIS